MGILSSNIIQFLSECDKNRKDFGLFTSQSDPHERVQRIAQAYCIEKDARQEAPFKEYMDDLVLRYASSCPFCKNSDRGFVILPTTLEAISKELPVGERILGYFHAHCCDVPGVDMSIAHSLDIMLHSWQEYYVFVMDMVGADGTGLKCFEIL